MRSLQLVIALLLLLFLNVFTDARHFQCDRKRSCGCGKSNVEIKERITSGEEAVPYSWSMIVSIRYDLLNDGNSFMHVCGGSILTESYILTAANCFDQIKKNLELANVTITAGIHKQSQERQIVRDVDKIIIHPNWTGSWNRHENDLALLHLSEPLDLQTDPYVTRTCLSVQLSTSEELLKYPLIDTKLATVGWGRTVSNGDNSEILRQTMVSVMAHNHTKCVDIISDPNKQFCAGSSANGGGSCYGDFGGPIFQWLEDHWEQVGIASFTPNGCRENSAIGYTRIAYYRHWIDTHIKTNDTMTAEPPMSTTTVGGDIIPSITYRCEKHEVPCGCGRRNVQFFQSDNIEAIPYSWSMIVSIRLNGRNKHLCSGTILSESYILTSASCVVNASTFGIMIAAGIHNHSEDSAIHRRVDRIYLHPNYTGILDNYANDMAILHISEPFNFDDNLFLSRTCLIEKRQGTSNSYFYPYPGTKLAVIGWGGMNCQNRTEQDLLQQIEVYSISDQDKNCYILSKHQDMQFCAGLDDQKPAPCVGDPGSPIFQWNYDRWEQVGIASYVFDCVPFRNVGIYTRTVDYNDWIRSIISHSPTTSPPTTGIIGVTTTTQINENTTTTTVKLPMFYPCNVHSTCGCGIVPVVLTPSRIVGGENAVEYSWPMIVSMRLFGSDGHHCGGSILSNSYILTAAHCLYGYISNPPEGVTIAVGLTNLSDPKKIIRTVDHVYIHADYIGLEDSYRHDIAVLHLSQPLPIEYNPFLTKTCIHRVNPPILSEDYIKNGTRLTVIGWGDLKQGSYTYPTILQQTEVYAIDNNDRICKAAMNDSITQFCAGLHEGGKDSCQGDSGGPIFQWTGQYWEQVGIVSHGNGCAAPNEPGIYTRLSYYYDWINDILKNGSEHLEPQFSTNETTIKPDAVSTSTIVTSTTSKSEMDFNSTIITNETTTEIKSNACTYQRNTLTFTLLIVLLTTIFK